MDCHQNIKLKRQEKGLTQQQLADKMGVSRQTVARWENGWNVPTLFYAQKLACEFGVSVDGLMDSESTDKQTVQPLQKKMHKLFTIKYIFLSFLVAFTYAVLNSIVDSAYRYLAAVEGAGKKYDMIFDAVFGSVDALAYAATAAVFVFLALAFYKEWKSTDDMFLRYAVYKYGNFTLGVIVVNFVVILFSDIMSLIAFETLLVYAAAVFIVAPLDFIFDYLFKKKNSGKMVVESNPVLGRLNLVFVIIAVLVFSALAAYLLYYFINLAATDCGLGLLFPVLYFALGAIGVELVYGFIRLILRTRAK